MKLSKYDSSKTIYLKGENNLLWYQAYRLLVVNALYLKGENNVTNFQNNLNSL